MLSRVQLQKPDFSNAGNKVSADTILKTGFRSLASQLTSTEEDRPEAMEIVSSQGESVPAVAQSPAETAFQEQVLSKICNEFIYHSRTEVKPFKDHDHNNYSEVSSRPKALSSS